MPDTAFSAVLFDLDGTLVRTFIDFPAMTQTMRRFAAKYGAETATQDSDDILEIVEKTVQVVGPDGEQARQEAYALLEVMEQEGCAHPEPIEGASALLEELRARGVSIGVITRNCRAVAEQLMGQQCLTHDVLVAREDTTEFKPHPAPVLLACRRLAVGPENCAMVGDLWADIAAGKAAGVRTTIGIQWAHDPRGRFVRCPPTIEVSSLAEAVPLLLGG